MKAQELNSPRSMDRADASCSMADRQNMVIDVWFGDAQHTDVTRQIEEYVLSGGVYGIKSNDLAVRQKKAGSRFQYILQRIFMPYRALKVRYPILEKHPWLTPVYQVVRWTKKLRQKKLGTFTRELNMIRSLSDDRVAEINLLMNAVGLS